MNKKIIALIIIAFLTGLNSVKAEETISSAEYISANDHLYKDIQSYKTLVDANSNKESFQKAYALFRENEALKIKGDASVEEAQKLHAQMVEVKEALASVLNENPNSFISNLPTTSDGVIDFSSLAN